MTGSAELLYIRKGLKRDTRSHITQIRTEEFGQKAFQFGCKGSGITSFEGRCTGERIRAQYQIMICRCYRNEKKGLRK